MVNDKDMDEADPEENWPLSRKISVKWSSRLKYMVEKENQSKLMQNTVEKYCSEKLSEILFRNTVEKYSPEILFRNTVQKYSWEIKLRNTVENYSSEILLRIAVPKYSWKENESGHFPDKYRSSETACWWLPLGRPSLRNI